MKAIVLTENTMNELVTELSKRIFIKVVQMPTLSGEEILQLPAHPQIGQFILFQVFQEWKSHASQIKHPYFDFKNENVQQALQHLQNILSFHIQIEQKDFKQMLDKSCWNTLRLLLNPTETIVQFFFTGREYVSVEILTQYGTYFSDFDFCLAGLLTYTQTRHLQKLTKDECVHLIPKIFSLWEQSSTVSLSEYRAQRFLQLTGFDITRLIEVVQPEMEDIVLKPTYKETMETPDPIFVPENKTEIERGKIEKETPSETHIDAPNRVYQQFQPVSKFSEKKSYSLDQIPLHKQFQYIQKLFGGDHQKYNAALQKIQTFPSTTEVTSWLQTYFTEATQATEIYSEFYEMVIRSFGA